MCEVHYIYACCRQPLYQGVCWPIYFGHLTTSWLSLILHVVCLNWRFFWKLSSHQFTSLLHFKLRSWDSIISMLTGRCIFRIWGRERGLAPLQSALTSIGTQPASCSVGTRGSFLGLKWLGWEADHTAPPSAKIECSNTFIPPVCHHGVYMHNFSFYIKLKSNFIIFLSLSKGVWIWGSNPVQGVDVF